MGKNTSIILGDHFDNFIKEELSNGRYASASEVIRSGLRRLEEDKKLKLLIDKALVVGESSGKPIELDPQTFLKRMKAKHVK